MPVFRKCGFLCVYTRMYGSKHLSEWVYDSTLTANIRRRRGAKVEINMPIFHDKNTPRPFIDPTIPWDRDVFPHDKEAKNGAAKPDHIYMDAMAFGMGCCCLQITFQACNIDEARHLYDHLAPVAPIMVMYSWVERFEALSADIVRRIACIDSCMSHFPWLSCWCGLSMECDCCQCGWSHARRTRIEGIHILW